MSVNWFFLSLLASDLRRSRPGSQVRKRSASFRKVARQKKIEEQKDKEVERGGWWREKGEKGGEGRVRGNGRKEDLEKESEGGGEGQEGEGGKRGKELSERLREARVSGGCSE